MNIVEDNSRRSKKSKLQFISYSAGSIEELDYQLLLARDLKYISEAEFQILRKQIGKVSYLLDHLKKSIQSKE